MLRHSLIYIFAEVFNKGIPFLLLPLLTRYLTPYDYGIIASFSAFVGLVSIFAGMSANGAINVNFFQYSHKKLKVYIANAIFLLAGMLVLGILFVLVFHAELSKRLLLDTEWLYIGIVVSIAQMITLINLTLWLSEKKPKSYSVYQILQTVLVSLLTLVMIIGYGMHWEGRLIAITLGSISFGLISLYILHSRDYLEFRCDKESLKDLFRFGIPLIPHQLAGWLTTNGDRLLLITLIGASATGLFSVGYQIGMIMSVIVTAFHKAWTPYIYGKLSRGMSFSEKQKVVKYMYVYFIFIIVLIFVLDKIGFYFFKYWIDETFKESYQYVIFILIAYGFRGMYFMVVSYIFYFKKTKQLALITFISSVVHISLSYLFIQLYGAIGVAYSSIISYGLMFFWVFIYSQKIYPLPLLLRGENESA